MHAISIWDGDGIDYHYCPVSPMLSGPAGYVWGLILPERDAGRYTGDGRLWARGWGSCGRHLGVCGPWFLTSDRAVLNLMEACGQLQCLTLVFAIRPEELGQRRPCHAGTG
jgi:hypothetical protein